MPRALRPLLAAGLIWLFAPAAQAAAQAPPEAAAAPEAWYERLSVRGYAQMRVSQWLSGDDRLVTDADRSVGPDTGFIFRRVRIALSGDLGDRVSFSIQPDFASSAGDGPGNFVQLRDLYADVFLDAAKESRLRIGQAKIPYGFENMQSSQNRLALDRSDAINSAFKDERDLGLFYYWAPAAIRARLKHLVDSGLKGSGDFGVVGLGVFNGQGANRLDENETMHVVGHLAWPFELANGQFFELGLQGYRGRFVPRTSSADAARGIPAVTVDDPAGLADERIALSATYYPQPFGLQAEYNVGQGPQLSDDRTRVGTAPLSGGYVQAMYRLESAWGPVIPYLRYHQYTGGKKAERDAPRTRVSDAELGVEWHPTSALELTVTYSLLDRTDTQTWPYDQHQGGLLRSQLQWNF